jgi:hypothetical protein
MSFNVQNTLNKDPNREENFFLTNVDVLDLNTANRSIDPNTPITYIINNTSGSPVTVYLPNYRFAGRQKYVTVVENGNPSNIVINFTDNHENTGMTTNGFGTVGDIIQFVSSTKGWGITWFDIK